MSRAMGHEVTPLIGCFPVCSLFLALGIVGVITYIAGAGSGDPESPPAESFPRPPYWVVPVVLLAAVVVLLLLSMVTDG